MEHILSLSYGKDSLGCLGAIEKLGLPLDRIIHAEIWATDTIPADLPPMIDFKEKADKIIKERYGLTVEHISAKTTYENLFYKKNQKQSSSYYGKIYGFCGIIRPWCNSRLKVATLERIDKNAIKYVGIAFDEPKRFKILGDTKISPLVKAEWTEKMCYDWCLKNDLLSPIYSTSTRGGCWFCHNQSVEQLRLLRRNYPDYWELLLKWDNDSPVTFKPGRTVHDFDKRFKLEDEGLINPNEPFKWEMIKDDYPLQLKFF